MRPLASMLETRGFRVFNLAYPSRTAGVRALAWHVAQQVRDIDDTKPFHFITHSLGGILLRVAVANGDLPLEHIKRVVMLGPPNGGSHVPDAFGRWKISGALYRFVTGPAGLELGIGAGSIVGELPPLPFEAGIIAGSRSVNRLLSLFLPGENDGKVSVEHASVAGMKAFLVLPHSHPFLMRIPAVMSQAIRFLETGTFAP